MEKFVSIGPVALFASIFAGLSLFNLVNAYIDLGLLQFFKDFTSFYTSLLAWAFSWLQLFGVSVTETKLHLWVLSFFASGVMIRADDGESFDAFDETLIGYFIVGISMFGLFLLPLFIFQSVRFLKLGCESVADEDVAFNMLWSIGSFVCFFAVNTVGAGLWAPGQ